MKNIDVYNDVDNFKIDKKKEKAFYTSAYFVLFVNIIVYLCFKN